MSARIVEYFSAAGPDRDLAAPPDAGGVDEDDLASGPTAMRGVDGVARRARGWRTRCVRSSPRSALSSEDLPTFGRPTNAIAGGSSSSAAMAASQRAAMSSVEPASGSSPSASSASSSSSSASASFSGAPTTYGAGRARAISLAQASASSSRALRAISASLSGGSAQTTASSRSATPRPWLRGDRERVLPAEGVELGGVQLALLVVGLVGGDEHGLRGPAQELRGVLVGRA